jgi:hypothetical protein
MLHFPSQKTLFEVKKKHFENFNMTKKTICQKKKLAIQLELVVIHIAIGCFCFRNERALRKM